MNKKLIKTLLALTLIPAIAYGAPEQADSTGFIFTDVISIPTTAVRDQNRSGTCWSFSSGTFFENEILRKTGKEVDLSDMWTVRHCYGDKADRYVRLYGQGNFAAGGSFADLPYVWRTYGMVP